MERNKQQHGGTPGAFCSVKEIRPKRLHDQPLHSCDILEEVEQWRQYSKGNCLVVCWLGLCTVTAKGPGSVPGRETKIPQAMWYSQKKNTSGDSKRSVIAWGLGGKENGWITGDF